MIYLPDVNFWIALTSSQHVHSAIATAWMDQILVDQVAFCRITELGLLRLLTNSRVMGSGVKDHAGAWSIYDQIRRDGRVVFLSEKQGFDDGWSRARHQISGGPNAWTDAYLAVFATHQNASIVTFDRGFKSLHGCQVILLRI